MTTKGWLGEKKAAAAAALILCLAASGCGLGTEIGNGKKPKDSPEPQTANSNDGDDSDDDAKDGIETANQDNTGAPAGENDQAVDGVVGASEGFTQGIGFNVPLLGAACASPFANSFHENLVLRRTDMEADPAAELTAKFTDGEWLVSTDIPVFHAKADPGSGEFAVQSAEAEHDDPLPAYTCGEVKLTTSGISGKPGTFARIAVTLTGAEGSQELIWFSRLDEADQPHLVRIEVKVPADAAKTKSVILDVVP